jgi:hypothetical protein
MVFSQFSYARLLLNGWPTSVNVNYNNNVSSQQTERLRTISVITNVAENQKFISRFSSFDSMLILPKGISKKIAAVTNIIANKLINLK